jgi:ParB/RepB/Spo0J family partition protein
VTAADRKIEKIGLAIAEQSERLRAVRPEVVAALAESMARLGQLQPIVITPRKSAGYFLIAGKHRVAAAVKLKWDTIEATVLEGLDLDRAQLAEIDENLVRADLSPAERAMHVAKRKEIYERIHPETKHGAVGRGRKKSSQDAKSFAEETARATGQHRATVARDAARGTHVKVLAEVAGTSLDKGDELDALAKLPETSQRALVARAKDGEKVSAKTEVKKERRQEREAELGAKQAALPVKRYGVILCDPPWEFRVYSDATGSGRTAASHYPTMAPEQLRALDVPSLAASDCALFLWATPATLAQAVQLIEVWGFEYKTEVVWAKDKIGLGFWFRNKHESVLVATRGSPPCPAHGTQFSSLVEAPRGAHSAKPPVSRSMIETMFPNLPKLEMFARGKAPAGRDFFGNEVTP